MLESGKIYLITHRRVNMENNYWDNYSEVILETPEERVEKRKKQRKTFSRVFIALSLYVVLSQFFAIGIYTIANLVMSEENYLVFANNSIISLIIGAGVQYVIMLPIFMLLTAKMRTAENREKTPLSPSDFLIIFVIGQAFMYLGSVIGNILNSIVGGLTGHIPENNIDTTISSTPMWLIIILMVIVAPVVEELIFRKIVIDRLSVFGDRTAIIFSGVAFGLVHANLYQFFYAAFLGIILGYVYTKTRDIKYSILLHMLINFFGSVVALYVSEAAVNYQELLNWLSYRLSMGGQFYAGPTVNLIELAFYGIIYMLYTTLQTGMLTGGILALTHCIRNKKIKVSPDADIYLPNNEIYKGGIVNVGAISFIAVTLILTILNLFL